MKVKATVVLAGVSVEVGYALGVAALIHRERFNADLVVTSARDSMHNTGSLHYVGKAADLRTRDLHGGEQATFVQLLKNELEPLGFDVVLENDHIHIEFDPKAGESFTEVVT